MRFHPPERCVYLECGRGGNALHLQPPDPRWSDSLHILEDRVGVLILSWLSSEESLEKVPEVRGVLPAQSFQENEY